MVQAARSGKQNIVEGSADGVTSMELELKLLNVAFTGIDHVGLGTDFDGDGGIRGLADSSELLQFTRQLLARGFSEDDIQKIWGGNFMRVMTQVQNSKQ